MFQAAFFLALISLVSCGFAMFWGAVDAAFRLGLCALACLIFIVFDLRRSA